MSRLVLPELQDAASGRRCADLGLKTRNCLAHLARRPLSPGLRETEVGYLPRCSLASMARGSQSALGLRRRLSGLQHSPPGYVDTGHLPVLEQRTHTSLVSLGCPHPSTGQARSANPGPGFSCPDVPHWAPLRAARSGVLPEAYTDRAAHAACGVAEGRLRNSRQDGSPDGRFGLSSEKRARGAEQRKGQAPQAAGRARKGAETFVRLGRGQQCPWQEASMMPCQVAQPSAGRRAGRAGLWVQGLRQGAQGPCGCRQGGQGRGRGEGSVLRTGWSPRCQQAGDPQGGHSCGAGTPSSRRRFLSCGRSAPGLGRADTPVTPEA